MKKNEQIEPLNIDIDRCKYKTIIGTGGIGSGKFFMLNGDHTLGREESRSGYIPDRNDYCKLHIISHYVKTLLGKDFKVIPVGKVGADDTGANLIKEMDETGLDIRYVETDDTRSTLFSFCLIYPDNSGSNLTTDNSASSSVNESTISKVKNEFKNYAGRGVVFSVPEVPLKAREKLLKYGRQYEFLCVASFTSEEMNTIMKSDILKNVDLLAVNLDEAAFAVKKKVDETDTKTIVGLSIEAFRAVNPEIAISITNGKYGSWLWDGKSIFQHPSLKVDVVNTAGAGDAFLSGLIIGITAGLSLKEAQQLAALTGGCSVTSLHTINKEMNRVMLNEIAKSSLLTFSKSIDKLLEV